MKIRTMFIRVFILILLLAVVMVGCYPFAVAPEGTPGSVTPTGFIPIIPLTGKEAEEATQPPEGATPEAAATAVEGAPTEATPIETPIEVPVVPPTETAIPEIAATETPIPETSTSVPTSTESAPQDDDTLIIPTAVPTIPGLARAAAISLPWTGDFETGNISQWQAYGDWLNQADSSTYSIVTSPVHNGNYAAGLTIDTSTASDSGSYASYLCLWNQTLLTGNNYYSAWFYIPSGVEPQQWWSIWQWKSTYNGDTDYSVRTYAINIRDNGTNMELVLARRPSAVSETSSNNIMYYQTLKTVPTDTWFQIKAYYKRAVDNTGQVIIWQDGTEIYNIQNVNTVFTDGTLYWSVHNYTDNIIPNKMTIYIDDAKVESGSSQPTSTTAVISTPTKTSVPTATKTPTSTKTNTPTATKTPTSTKTNTPTATKTPTSPTVSVTPTKITTATVSPTVKATSTSTATTVLTPSKTPTPGPTPATPSAISPVGRSVQRPYYRWTSVAGATSYDLYTTGNGSGNYSASTYCSRGLCSVRSPSNLSVGTTYSWYVKARNANGAGNASATLTFTVLSRISKSTTSDLDGITKTDLAVYQNASWYESNLSTSAWQTKTEKPIPGDYNGDGLADAAVFKPATGTWIVKDLFTLTEWGEPGDYPVPADYDADGVTDIAVFRASSATWYIYGVGNYIYGLDGDLPVPGDYDGDGTADIAVFRPESRNWYVRNVGSTNFGISGDLPVPEDYNNDGITDIAIWRPETSTWLISGIGSYTWGKSTDIPVPGDYNGDGKVDIAIWRPSSSTWYVRTIGSVAWGRPANNSISLPTSK